MTTVHVTHLGASGFEVSFPVETAGDESTTDTAAHEEELDEGPSPIAPEVKELLWGLGAFFVFLLLMRFYLFPKVKQGMEARYGAHPRRARDRRCRSALRPTPTSPSTSRRWPRYAPRRRSRIEAARTELEGQRSARLAEVNAAHRRQARAPPRPKPTPAREAARGQIEAAVADVASRTAELTVGRAPDAAAVRQAVDAP